VVTCILVGVVLRGVFRVFTFGCSIYVRRLLFVFSVSLVSVRLEQRSGCLIKFDVSKKKSTPFRIILTVNQSHYIKEVEEFHSSKNLAGS